MDESLNTYLSALTPHCAQMAGMEHCWPELQAKAGQYHPIMQGGRETILYGYLASLLEETSLLKLHGN